ncbi:MAG: esterase/lipase family protein [Rhodothermales bacterium]
MAKFRDNALRRFVGLEPFPQPPLICTRYPVVLMHGFGLLAGLRKHGHLHHEAMDLRRHGVIAYAPNVAPYNTVPVRASMWQDRIEYILEETGAERLNLIAQSMGGLDARYLISTLGLHEAVATLVTVSSPHRGTAIAEIALKQPERLRQWTADLANWMGANTLDDGTADILQAVKELTPAYICDSFNPSVPDHPAIRYWSYAGQAGKGTRIPINPFLKIPNTMLFQREGVNDGMVSVESARWGEYLGTLDADHAQEVGLQGLSSHSFDSKAFYRSVVKMLAAEGY